MSHLNNQHIRQVSFYALLIFLIIFLFMQLASFLPALLGATTFYILMRSRMLYLVYERKWTPNSAAVLLLILSFLIILLPIGGCIMVLSSKVNYAIAHVNQIVQSFQTFIRTQEAYFKIEFITEANLQKINSSVASFIPNVLGATVNSITTTILLYLILYFMLVNSREMETWLQKNIPLKDENVTLIGTELNKLVISNAIGIPLTALVQGLVAVFGYWALGVNDLWFWFVFTCICAMIPMFGSGLAYFPISILLFVQGENTKGLLLIIYGILFIGSSDNVFRFLLQRKLGDVHPLITIFGVLIGINLFGFIGLIFGPILISLLILLIRIYINEFGKPKIPEEIS